MSTVTNLSAKKESFFGGEKMLKHETKFGIMIDEKKNHKV